MSNTDLLSRLEETLTPPVNEHGLFLEGVAVTGSPNRRVLRVTVDLTEGTGGVGSDTLESLTRAISTILDEEDPLPGAYQLEVSTPGVDRPLTTPRHFGRNVGRLVKVTTAGDEPETFTARITSVESGDVVLEADSGERRIGVEDISEATVELEFRPRGRRSQ